MLKQFKVIYRSKYHPLEGDRSKIVQSASKSDIRKNWHDIISTDEYRITLIEDVEGIGLHIRTIKGDEFDVHGPVTSKDFPEDGTIYYCAGQSWPASIVTEIFQSNANADRLHKEPVQQEVS